MELVIVFFEYFVFGVIDKGRDWIVVLEIVVDVLVVGG